MPILVNHVTYKYNPDTAMEKTALDDVSLEIKEGEILAIIGHTGSGKSTLVQHLNGLMKATEGGVYFDGENIYSKDFSLKQLRSNVGLVFQYPEHQLFEADVFSDVCFGPRNMGLERKEVEMRAYTALKQVGIEDEYFYQSPFDLSGGQKRRVAIAGVLAMKPRFLVLDEPTAGLDPKGRDDIFEKIVQIREETNTGIVLVSHSMEDVANYADRIVVMDHGKIVYNDVPSNVFKNYKHLEEIGLSAPQISYAMHELKDAGLDINPDVYKVDDAVSQILEAFRK
ncbi:MAG: energy-coupling factor transporter ATPase [Lachnospiraceae bacterium]|nr:energy-coupling factor transporter ATPase [Lachnospiraceae bacterium]